MFKQLKITNKVLKEDCKQRNLLNFKCSQYQVCFTGTLLYKLCTIKQSFGSVLVSMRIRIQHFRSMCIRMRIQIQDFDDQKLNKKIYSCKKLVIFVKNAIYLSLGLLKGRPSYRRSLQLSPSKLEFSVSFSNFLVFFALLDPDPDPHFQCRSGSGSSRLK
jgi:hypothetical protein